MGYRWRGGGAPKGGGLVTSANQSPFFPATEGFSPPIQLERPRRWVRASHAADRPALIGTVKGGGFARRGPNRLSTFFEK